jgi:hypothetical protein
MPITHGSLETATREAARLEHGIRITLIDQASVRRWPGALEQLPGINGQLTDTLGVRFWSGHGADALQATAAEDTDVVETDVTTTSVNIAVVRHSLVRNIGDLAEMTASPSGDITAEALARDMVQGQENRFTDVFATTLATASTDVGTSGSNMVHDDYMDAIFTLQIADATGPYYCALHARQLSDWQESLRAEGGAVHLDPATLEMLRIKDQGIVGSFLGVNITRLSRITSDGTDRQGGMWGAGCFGFRLGIPLPPKATSTVAARVDELQVEYTRTATRGLTTVVGNSWFGIGILEQARLVGIVTDA